jgi:hypothetical protein
VTKTEKEELWLLSISIIFPKQEEQSSRLYRNPRKGVAMWFILGIGLQQINDVQWAY